MLLKEICSFSKGLQVKRDLTSTDYDIPYLHYGDLYKKYNVSLKLNEEYNKIIKVNRDCYNVRYQIDNNNIVMNLTSENYDDLGKCVIIKNPKNTPFIAGMETHLIKIHSQLIIPEYLNYYFESSSFLQTIHQFITGMKVFRVKPDDILNIDITLPNLRYQQHIVDIIGSIDDKIENNQKLIGRLEKLAELLFDNLYCNAINSNNYKICKLKDYAETIITGTTPSTKEDKYWGNDINFITIPDMQNNIFIINTERKLANSVKTKFSSRIITKNTLIASCIATVGLVSIASKTSLTNQQINSIIFHNEKDVYFFYQYLKKMKDYLIQLGSGGSATLNINKNAFSNIKVKIPNSKLLTSYLNKVEIIYNYIQNIQRENLKLINLKQLYLKKFFR